MKTRASWLGLLLLLAACGQNREGQAPERGDGSLEKGVQDILPPPPNAPQRAELEGRSPVGPLVATLQGLVDPVGSSGALKGTVRFVPTPTTVEVYSSIQALPVGAHKLQVHLYGDCSDVANGSAGPVLDLRTLRGEAAPYSDPKDRGASEMERQNPPGRTIFPREPRVQADGAPPTPSPLGPSDAAPGVGPASEGAPDAASSGASRTAGSTGAPPAGSESAQLGQGSGDLGELVGVTEGVAEAHFVLEQLTPGNLAHLVGRALVILPTNGQSGEPIACGVIGVASPTSTAAASENQETPSTPRSGSEGLAP